MIAAPAVSTGLVIGLVVGLVVLTSLATTVPLVVMGFRAVRRRARIAASGVPGLARIMGTRETGVTINDGPLLAFDLALTVDGRSWQPAATRQRVPQSAFGLAKPGELVPVMVALDGSGEVSILWDAVSALVQARHGRPGMVHLGLFAVPLAPPVAGRLGITPVQGYLVLEAPEGEPAHRVGVVPGDLLLAIDGTPLRTSADLTAALSRARPGGQPVQLAVRRGHQVHTVAVPTGAA